MSKQVSLDSLDNGGVTELFATYLEAVAANIQDPNTKAEGVREITLVFKFKPNKDRNYTPMTYSGKTKLLPAQAVEIPLFVDKDSTTKKARVVELNAPDENPGQHRLPAVDKVSDIQTARQG
jgi:hypothetical protein